MRGCRINQTARWTVRLWKQANPRRMLLFYQCGRKTSRRTHFSVSTPISRLIEDTWCTYKNSRITWRWWYHVPSKLTVLTLGNEDPSEKKAKDQDILETALPQQSHFLRTREPMLNYADSELCGKWKVLHPVVSFIDVLGSWKVAATLVSRGK